MCQVVSTVPSRGCVRSRQPGRQQVVEELITRPGRSFVLIAAVTAASSGAMFQLGVYSNIGAGGAARIARFSGRCGRSGVTGPLVWRPATPGPVAL